MLPIVVVIFAMLVIVFFAKPLLRKLNIPKAAESRAKLLHKRVWGGSDAAIPYVRVRELIPKKEYFLTFTYMVENAYTDYEFLVSQKDYDAFNVGDEGILKHHYTDFIGFDRFEKQ